jgi:hypothetical protein
MECREEICFSTKLRSKLSMIIIANELKDKIFQKARGTLGH